MFNFSILTKAYAGKNSERIVQLVSALYSLHPQDDVDATVGHYHMASVPSHICRASKHDQQHQKHADQHFQQHQDILNQWFLLKTELNSWA